ANTCELFRANMKKLQRLDLKFMLGWINIIKWMTKF
ncbi:unnamed protein product, partial [marine sediment metagenome]